VRFNSLRPLIIGKFQLCTVSLTPSLRGRKLLAILSEHSPTRVEPESFYFGKYIVEQWRCKATDAISLHKGVALHVSS
jgi:hypothetical protein